MTDHFASKDTPPDGEHAMAALAERIAAMVPPPQPPSLAVAAAPAPNAVTSEAAEQSAAAAETSVEDAPRRRGAGVAEAIGGFRAAFAFIPNALVALALRVLMAAVFLFDAQTRGGRAHVVFGLRGFDFSLVLPQQVRAETLVASLGHAATLPFSPAFAADLITGAEFLLPSMLVVGLCTRSAAFGLLLLTALLQLYGQADVLWTQHIYWAAILLVLLSGGPGPVSLDHVIRLRVRRRMVIGRR